MRICFCSQGELLSYLQALEEQDGKERDERAQGGKAQDGKAGKEDALTVFAFHGGEVCYERELKGETQFFESVAKLSKRENKLVVCGVVTNTHGHRRKSAVVAENGRILGVSDALGGIDGEVHSGAYLRVYETKIGRVGVAVAEDIYDVATVKTLALCGCDFIVCTFEEVQDSLCSVLLRAYAFISGVPVFFCGRGYSMIADVDGALAFASPLSPVLAEFSVKKEFHCIETRKKLYLKQKIRDK